jgi:hypothetical protein
MQIILLSYTIHVTYIVEVMFKKLFNKSYYKSYIITVIL